MVKKYNWKKIIIIFLFIGSVSFALLIYFSPFSYREDLGYRAMVHKVEINASVDSVFTFLGNSDNASKWSVFVHHIVPLNGDLIKDGQVGSTRRCFCYANEQGRMWDEMITEVVPNQKRQLTIYNMKDFSMEAPHLATEQKYKSIGMDKCQLTFTVFFKDHQPSMWELTKTYLAAYIIQDIFEQNMNNIKRIIETGA